MVKDRKAIGQFRLQLNGALAPLMRVEDTPKVINGVKDDIAVLALQLHERLSGNDVPIKLKEK